MGKKTGILWCDSTFNGWVGCSRVSPGCVHCYAEELMANRYKRVTWGNQGTRLRTSENYWKQPITWNEEAKKTGVSHRVFCGSLCDWLEIHPSIIRQWRVDLTRLIEATPYLTWLMLTKRPENFYDSIAISGAGWVDEVPSNVWFGISAEDQKRADERREVLRSIPAETKFVSYEPAIGPVDWSGYEFIDWLIIGGESDRVNPRPFYLHWAESSVEWCYKNSVKPFVKQLGSSPSTDGTLYPISDYKGEIMAEWPVNLRVQEFPND